MLFKVAFIIMLSGVAVSAVVFLIWDKEINQILNEEEHRKYLEKCLRSEHADSSREDDH
jgi:hypothetical protein